MTDFTLAALVEVLLPGDELFPCGATLGLEGLLADRLRQSIGRAELDALTAALAATGTPFAALAPAARLPVVTQLEREHPALFDLLAKAAYLPTTRPPPSRARSERWDSPTIRRHCPPAMPSAAFDAERDMPRHGRGRFLADGRRARSISAGSISWVRLHDRRNRAGGPTFWSSARAPSGAIAGLVLGEAGLKVVCLEQGEWTEPSDHPHFSRRLGMAARSGNWHPEQQCPP